MKNRKLLADGLILYTEFTYLTNCVLLYRLTVHSTVVIVRLLFTCFA